MMQYTEASPVLPPPLHQPQQTNGLVGFTSLDGGAAKSPLYRARRPWPVFPTSGKTSSQLQGGGSSSFNSAGCMEQLLVHCANAIEANDATLAQQILWVLNNIAPPDGDPNQRLAAAFLRALTLRASRTGTCKAGVLLAAASTADTHACPPSTHRFSPLALAGFIDLTPWHRFGYAAANAAIVDAVEGFPVVHVVDLSTTHCMQIPTLIDALASRPEGPPFLKLTVAEPPPAGESPSPSPPPTLDVPYDELGRRLVSFARARSMAMEFKAVPSGPSEAFSSLIDHLRVQQLVSSTEGTTGEALVVNCQMMLRYIPEETATATAATSLRSMFLKAVRGLNPVLVTVVEEDVDLTAGDLVGRLRAAFNYLWIPYDAVEALLPRGSEQRRWFEAEVVWKIENVVACEGGERVERPEGRGRWAQRMQAAGFRAAAGFGEEAAAGEVRGMLEEHAAGWGVKKEAADQDDGGGHHHHLVLTWKGHNVVFAAAWVPQLLLDSRDHRCM